MVFEAVCTYRDARRNERDREVPANARGADGRGAVSFAEQNTSQ